MNKSDHPVVIWMLVGMLLGLAIGCVIGISQGNIGLSMCFGLVFGKMIEIAIGTAKVCDHRAQENHLYKAALS